MRTIDNWYEEVPSEDRTSHAGLSSTAEATAKRCKTVAGLLNDFVPGSKPSILDIGCGYGDLAKHLPDRFQWTGCEPTHWVYANAIKTNPELVGLVVRASFPNHEIWRAEEVDVAVALGILATTRPENLKGFIDEMLRVSRRGILVSFLLKGEWTDNNGLVPYSIREVSACMPAWFMMEKQARGSTRFMYASKHD